MLPNVFDSLSEFVLRLIAWFRTMRLKFLADNPAEENDDLRSSPFRPLSEHLKIAFVKDQN